MIDNVISLLLGISLSAACGFRVFLPLLAVSIAAVVGHLQLPANLAWVGSDHALIMLAIASVLEITAYYLPWFDHLLDAAGVPLAMAAGTIVTASVAPDMHPLAQWTLAAIAGGGAAGLTYGLTGILRWFSTMTTGGLGNFMVSTLEWVSALVLSLMAFTVPVVSGVMVTILLGYSAYKLWNFVKGRQPAAAD